MTRSGNNRFEFRGYRARAEGHIDNVNHEAVVAYRSGRRELSGYDLFLMLE